MPYTERDPSRRSGTDRAILWNLFVGHPEMAISGCALLDEPGFALDEKIILPQGLSHFFYIGFGVLKGHGRRVGLGVRLDVGNALHARQDSPYPGRRARSPAVRDLQDHGPLGCKGTRKTRRQNKERTQQDPCHRLFSFHSSSPTLRFADDGI